VPLENLEVSEQPGTILLSPFSSDAHFYHDTFRRSVLNLSSEGQKILPVPRSVRIGPYFVLFVVPWILVLRFFWRFFWRFFHLPYNGLWDALEWASYVPILPLIAAFLIQLVNQRLYDRQNSKTGLAATATGNQGHAQPPSKFACRKLRGCRARSGSSVIRNRCDRRPVQIGTER